MFHLIALTITFLFSLISSASAHGYIKQWSADGGELQKAQKTDLSSSAFRAVSDNTGWIGSDFLTNKAITCGASTTPFGKVEAPSGTLFSAADQGAGKELSIKSGGNVKLVVAGNPGQGWPHNSGHIATYLASCGESCTNFDATTGDWFKIQEEKNGVVNTLKPAYDGSLDGNPYTVDIPASVPSGSYLMRFELLSFGQSSSAEGKQDQYYPFCGQINIAGDSTTAKALAFKTVKFPGAYQDGNLSNESSPPGPAALATGAAGSGSTGTATVGSGSGDSGSATVSASGSTATGSSSGSGGKGGGCKKRRSLRKKRAHRAHRRHHAHNVDLSNALDVLS